MTFGEVFANVESTRGVEPDERAAADSKFGLLPRTTASRESASGLAKKPTTSDSLQHLTRAYGGIARKMLPSPNDQPAERSSEL